MYIELHAASAFSFLQGASLPETLVERAAALGYPALALLDADGVYGAPRFHKAAKQAGLKAIIGAELTIGGSAACAGGSASVASRTRRDPPHTTQFESGSVGQVPRPSSAPGRGPVNTWRLPVLVASADGYRNLCRLVTRMKMRAAKGEGSLAIEEFDGFASGLIALAGRPVLDAHRYGVGGLLDRIVGLFGRANVCVELQRHLLRDEESDLVALTGLARAFRVPVVATNGVRFAAVRGSSALRRPHLRPPQHDARHGGPSSRAQRRALPQVTRRDDAAVFGSA
jgi:error-prone DNA polymerase